MKRQMLADMMGEEFLQRPSTSQTTECQESGTKNDQNKPDLSLLSSLWVTAVGAVLSFGKRKYAAHNWRKGFAISRPLAASLRHIFAFLQGEDLDPESGLPHLAHASCSLMFAFELWQTRPDLDDRFRVPVAHIADAVGEVVKATAKQDPYLRMTLGQAIELEDFMKSAEKMGFITEIGRKAIVEMLGAKTELVTK